MYRTVVNATAFQSNSVLDIGEPVRDYARVRNADPRLWHSLYHGRSLSGHV